MIKLRKFIPEIKIIPNLGGKGPKIGRIYQDNYFLPGKKYKITAYDKFFDEWKCVNINRSADLDWYTTEELKEHFELKEFIVISEIKIQPNRKYQVGDHWYQPSSRDQDEMIITDIKDGNVYYDTTDGYWNDVGGNFRSIEEFNKMINSGHWVIIKKD